MITTTMSIPSSPPALHPSATSNQLALFSKPQLSLGTVIDDVARQARLVVEFDELLTHALFLGRTGSGKSKGLQKLIREYRDHFIPFILIDGEGDLGEDVFADVIAFVRNTGCEEILERTHYLRLSTQKVFGVNLFDDTNIPHNNPTAYAAWLHRTARLVAGAFIRSQNETTTEGMPRLERTLIDLFTAIGTPVGPNHARLPLASIFILLDFDHPKFAAVYKQIEPNLPSHVRADFQRLLRLHGANRHEDLLRQTESSINRLRSFLSPLIQAMVSELGNRTINLTQMIRDRGMIIFNLKDSEYFSPEQADIIGRVLIYQVISAMRAVGRAERFPCALVVDECQRYLTKDLLIGLAQGRKWGLATVLATQTLQALELVEPGFGMTVLAAVSTVFCLQQRLPADLDILGDYIFRPNLSFRELFSVQQLHRGYTWVDVMDKTESWTNTNSWNESYARATSMSSAKQKSLSLSKQKSFAKAQQSHWSDSETDSDQHSHTEGKSSGNSFGTGRNFGESPLIQQGQLSMMLPTEAYSDAAGAFEGNSESDTDAHGHARTRGSGGGVAKVWGFIQGLSAGESSSESTSTSDRYARTDGGSNSYALSISYKRQALSEYETIVQPQGKARWDISFQLEKLKTALATLPTAVAAVRRDGHRTELIQFDFIDDPFPHRAFKEAILREYEQKLHALHDYFFTPKIDAASEEQRIDTFLASVRHPSVVPPATPTKPQTKRNHPF